MAYQITVLVKQVADPNTIRIDRSTGAPVLSGQMAMSSFDEYAVEEAIQIKQEHGGEVVALTVGPASAKDALTRCLAMGADRGIHVQLDSANKLTTLELAEVLVEQLRDIQPDIVLAGQSSDDAGTGNTGPQVAELMGMPQVSSVTAIECEGSTITATRDTEFGKQNVRVETPVLLMAMTGLNEPRYPSLKGIMAAKKKPVDQVSGADAAAEPDYDWGTPLAEERAVEGVIIRDVPAGEAAAQLVALLREAKVI